MRGRRDGPERRARRRRLQIAAPPATPVRALAAVRLLGLAATSLLLTYIRLADALHLGAPTIDAFDSRETLGGTAD